MTERPISFSAPMVRALLAGTKTQTRRAIKPQPTHFNPVGVPRRVVPDGGPSDMIRCPYGQPGDRLRVKEAAWMWCDRRPNGTTKTGRQKWRYVPMRAAGIWYAADHRTKPNIGVVSPDTGNEWGWRLKIGRFLPAWASRITLEVTGVRVERLQDIGEADAKAEGAEPYETAPFSHAELALLDAPLKDQGAPYSNGYSLLWESINGAGAWAANPWVWVISFRRITDE